MTLCYDDVDVWDDVIILDGRTKANWKRRRLITILGEFQSCSEVSRLKRRWRRRQEVCCIML